MKKKRKLFPEDFFDGLVPALRDCAVVAVIVIPIFLLLLYWSGYFSTKAIIIYLCR